MSSTERSRTQCSSINRWYARMRWPWRRSVHQIGWSGRKTRRHPSAFSFHSSSPVREVKEETGLDVELVKLVAAVGGPRFELEYPNGDKVAYVGVVYDAVVVGGEVHPDGVETVEVTWAEATQLARLRLNSFGRSLVEQLGFPLDP